MGNKEYINGKGNSLCYKNLGNDLKSDLLCLWNCLKRDTSSESINNIIDKLMKMKNIYTCNLIFKILMQTRDCRGGKGEKEITYNGLLRMNKYLPKKLKFLLLRVY